MHDPRPLAAKTFNISINSQLIHSYPSSFSVFFVQVSGFQKDATKLLEMDKPDAKDIEKCLELGVSLDVDLQELSELKTKHKHMEWLEEVQEILDDPKGSSFEQMKEVLETGTQLQPHPAVERALGEISGMLTQADSWEEGCLSSLSFQTEPVSCCDCFSAGELTHRSGIGTHAYLVQL